MWAHLWMPLVKASTPIFMTETRNCLSERLCPEAKLTSAVLCVLNWSLHKEQLFCHNTGCEVTKPPRPNSPAWKPETTCWNLHCNSDQTLMHAPILKGSISIPPCGIYATIASNLCSIQFAAGNQSFQWYFFM